MWGYQAKTRFAEKSKWNPTTESSDLIAFKDYFDIKFNALEAKITNGATVVCTKFDERFNCYIMTVAIGNEFKNHKLEQTLRQKLNKEANISFRNKGNKLQYGFNFEQLVKLEEAKAQYAD